MKQTGRFVGGLTGHVVFPIWQNFWGRKTCSDCWLCFDVNVAAADFRADDKICVFGFFLMWYLTTGASPALSSLCDGWWQRYLCFSLFWQRCNLQLISLCVFKLQRWATCLILQRLFSPRVMMSSTLFPPAGPNKPAEESITLLVLHFLLLVSNI